MGERTRTSFQTIGGGSMRSNEFEARAAIAIAHPELFRHLLGHVVGFREGVAESDLPHRHPKGLESPRYWCDGLHALDVVIGDDHDLSEVGVAVDLAPIRAMG